MECSITANVPQPIVGVFHANFGKVLLYSRYFSSFFVRGDKILFSNYQAVTKYLKNNYKNTCTVLLFVLHLYNK